MDSQTLSWLIGVPLIGLILFFRLRRARRTTPLKLERMWIMPALVVVAAVIVFIETPPPLSATPLIVAALLIGAALGWIRGRMVQVVVDPQTHAINQQSSVAAVVFVLVLIAVRLGLRSLLYGEAQAWHLDPNTITDGFLALVVGVLVVQRLEVFWRASRLLRDARLARASIA